MSHVHLSSEECFAIEQLLLYGCGYRDIARKTGYHTAAILIGIILGPLLEQ